MSSVRLWERLALPASMVGLVTIVGTLGYQWLGRDQDATLMDALYMTVITITTVGYGEVIRLDGAGRIFTMFIATTGVGALFYTLTVSMDWLVMRRLSDPLGTRKMQQKIDRISNHIVIAGLGRVGRQASRELELSSTPFVIIDPSQASQSYALEHGYPAIAGDATDDGVLEKAGIRRAKGLIVTSGDDASNLYIVLSARVLNPDLFIVSRAVDESSVPKLLRAGADRAINPYAIGGRRLAHLIISPTVVDFFDTVISHGDENLSLEGIEIHRNSAVVGEKLADLCARKQGAGYVLAVLRGSQVLPNPHPDLVLQPNDQLLALGSGEQLERLVDLVAGE